MQCTLRDGNGDNYARDSALGRSNGLIVRVPGKRTLVVDNEPRNEQVQNEKWRNGAMQF